MRIAYLTDGLYPNLLGGMAKFSARLAEHLARLGADIAVFSPIFGSGEENLPGPLVRFSWPQIPTFPGYYVLENWILSRRMADVVRRESYDVIYAHGLTGWAIAKLPSNRRPPIVMNPHGLESFQPYGDSPPPLRLMHLRMAFRNALRRADCVISCSSYFTNLLQKRVGIERYKIDEISNGIDPQMPVQRCRNLISAENDGKFRLLFIGRNERRKGLSILLQAVRELANVRLTVAGPQPPPPDTPAARQPNIQFTGPVTDEETVISLYLSHDALVVPSLSEGQPTVILEAMACGLPVIASSVGGIPDMLSQGIGFLVPPGDVGALVDAVREVMRLSRSERGMYGMKGQELIKTKYSWDIVADQTLSLLRRLRENAARSSPST